MVKAFGEDAWVRFIEIGRPLGADTLRALSPMLILVPHPDDETLGCGGLISTASDLGLRPRIAFLTDGAASHPGSVVWPPPRLAATRRREALEALSILGVPAADVMFLGWPDSTPYGAHDQAYGDTQKKLEDEARRSGVQSLWAPWEGETHGDHVAAAGLAKAVSTSLALRLMNYLVWGWDEAGLASTVVRDAIWTLSCPLTVSRRRRALSCHLTQTTALIDDADDGFRIPPRLAALTERPAEVFLETSPP